MTTAKATRCKCSSRVAYAIQKKISEYMAKSEQYEAAGHQVEATVHRAWASGLREALSLALAAIHEPQGETCCYPHTPGMSCSCGCHSTSDRKETV